MIRRWALRPDPDMGIVPREVIVSAFMEAEAILDKIGGVLTVIYDRRRTDLEGEAETVGVIFEVKERTDAKPRPEVETHEVPADAAPPPEPEPERAPEPASEEEHHEVAAAPPPEPVERPAGDSPVLPFAGGAPQPTSRTGGQPEPDDGGVIYGADGEPEEDLTSIPAGMR